MALNFSMVFATSMIIMAAVVTADSSKATIVKRVKKQNLCGQGWECKGPSMYCCNETISDFFQVYQFENLFAKRNTPVAQAVGFWDYNSFILASAVYQPLGFGTTGGNLLQMKEVAAFLAHVGAKTSCGIGVSTGGPLAWGLCFKREMSPSQDYCYENYEYPCTPGVQYYGRGAIPIYGNKKYGIIGEGLKVDLLSHPEYLEQNATLAFQAAMWMWMTSVDKVPSPHEVFVGKWKPTKNGTLEKRVAGFGTTMNILYGDTVCGQGDDAESMNFIISHYQYYLDLMGVGRDKETHEALTCAQLLPFTRFHKSSS